jgi:hypothetical protein
MEYVTEYQKLPASCERGYIVSVGRNKTLIIISETLSVEERRKRLEKIIRRLELLKA